MTKKKYMQINKGKGPNININIDQSKRTTRRPAQQQPLRQSAPTNTITPIYMPSPQPTILNQAPPPSNPFHQVVQQTQPKKEQTNELERPKPKEPIDPLDEENHQFISMVTTGTDADKATQTPAGKPYDINFALKLANEAPAPKPKETPKPKRSRNLPAFEDPLLKQLKERSAAPLPFQKDEEVSIGEIANTHREPIAINDARSAIMTIDQLLNKEPKKEREEKKVEIIPFSGQGERLGGKSQEELKRDGMLYSKLTREPEKKEIFPLVAKPTIESTITPKKTYENLVLEMNKEELRAEAEMKGINVKGKNQQQVRDILLGKKEDIKNFKMVEPTEEVTRLKKAEARSRDVNILGSNELKRLAGLNGIKTYRSAHEVRQGKKKNLSSTDIANELLKLERIKGYDPEAEARPMTPPKSPPPPLPERNFPLVKYTPKQSILGIPI